MMKNLSRYAAALLACPVTPLEALFRGFLRAPMMLRTNSGQANQFAGATTLNSGTATVTISTAVVKSGDLINLGFQVRTLCGSGIGYMLGVSSVVDYTSFAVGYIDGQGRAPGGTVSWEIRRTS